jgi:DNA polymerase alpha subunit A
LQEVLSGREQEDIVEVVHELLRTVSEQVLAGAIHFSKFVITKQLTKQPEDYPDAKTQAHVQVSTNFPSTQMLGMHQPSMTALIVYSTLK